MVDCLWSSREVKASEGEPYMGWDRVGDKDNHHTGDGAYIQVKGLEEVDSSSRA